MPVRSASTSQQQCEGTGLAAPLTSLRGVGPARAQLLERLGLTTLGELVFHRPRRLETSGRACSIGEACETASGELLVFSGEVTGKRFNRFGRRSSLRLDVQQDGAQLFITYFNQAWQRNNFEKGATYTFAGRVTHSEKGPVVIAPRAAPGADSLPVGKWIPVYGVTEGLGQELLRSWITAALEQVAGETVELLAPDELARLDLPPLPEALRCLHAPATEQGFARAYRRVLLQDLLEIQARVLQRSASSASEETALVVPRAGEDAGSSALDLPFELTAGQREILATLDRDLARGTPMRRLLQGDVGTGKTVLALLLCARVARAGGQCAFMAPTELLAEQHFYGSQELLERAGLRAELLTGKQRAGERRARLKRLAAGEIDILFGTHALFSRDVHYAQLALCVIDEQQRFGVAQRGKLLEKGGAAHLLLMTATPIPRTLALTIYGDLDVSVLRERPAGRGEIRTRWLRPKDGERLPEFLRERLQANERVYWVCPRIGSLEDGGAEASHERLAQSELAPHGVALVHGKLDSALRTARLDAFRNGSVQLLVATTVIEVGVDVPEATVIVIEEAERLGLAQLHQLRGRVGRGPRPSWCLLFGKSSARERFTFLEGSSDGFEIAEEDLVRRGMGELAGLRQSGQFGAVLAALDGDLDLLLAARELLQANEGLRAALLGAS